MKKIRLFVNQQKIEIGNQVELENNDFDYLIKVMRQKLGSNIFIFNGKDGEFKTEIIEIKKKSLILEVIEKTAEFEKSPNITLSFSPVKNVKNDFIATKATELGVASISPIITQRTIVDKINLERFKLHIKEACEQCERNDLVQIYEAQKLNKFLSDEKTANKILILCDESGNGQKASEILPKISLKKDQEIVILIGPEGGFTDEEFQNMKSLPNLYSLSLGSRILRADTAIVAAITLVQEFLGDF